MIRFTKDGKVDRWQWYQSLDMQGRENELADALDIAVAVLRIIKDCPGAYRDSEQVEATKALHQIGADHAD